MSLGKAANLSCLLFFALCLVLGQSVYAQEVRVRVLDQFEPAEITVVTHESALSIAGNISGSDLLHVPSNRRATIRFSAESNGLIVDVQGSDTAVFRDSLLIDIEDSEGLLEIRLATGSGDITRKYDGSFRIYSDEVKRELQIVNNANLGSYVAAVLDREYALDDVEGTKAMAIVARTYAIRAMRQKGRFDVYDDTRSQVYHGIGATSARSREAVRETQGMVVTHNGIPIEAVYHASSGGHTADNDRVWASRPVPYLRGQPDPYDTSEHANWLTVVSSKGLHDTVSEKYGAEVVGVNAGSIDGSGRLETVSLLTADGSSFSIPANAFRLAVINRFRARTLRSLRFDIEMRDDVYHFKGSGYGHGVGLSQWGAHGMAKSGYSYDEILAHFYHSTDLSVLTNDGTGLVESGATPLIRRTSTTTKTPGGTEKAKKRIGW